MKQLFPILLLLFPVLSTAQGWERTYGVPGLRGAAEYSIQTADGGYVITGDHNCLGSSTNDCFPFLLKLDADGLEEWSLPFLDGNNGRGTAILETENQDLLFCGQTWTNAVLDRTSFIMKLDASGNEIWTTVLSDTMITDIERIFLLENGAYVLVGDMRVAGTNDSKGLLLRINEQGELTWRKEINSVLPIDNLNDAVLTSDNHIVVTGNLFKFDPIGSDFPFYIGKFNLAGEEIWHDTIGGDWNGGESLYENFNGEIIVANNYSPNQSSKINITKYDASGGKVWNQLLSGASGALSFPSVCPSDDNQIITASTVFGLPYLFQLDDNNGTILWEAAVDPMIDTIPEFKMSRFILNAADEGYLIVGSLAGDRPYMIKINGDGTTTSVRETAAKISTKVYPNPASTYMSIAIPSEFIGSEFIVYDYLGRTRYSGQLNSERAALNLKEFNAGFYTWALRKDFRLIDGGTLMIVK